MTEEHISKQIQLEFSLGNGNYKPGYIGEIPFEQTSNPIFEGAINSYLKYSAQTGCPVHFNFLSNDSERPFYQFFDGEGQNIKNILNEKLKIMVKLADLASKLGSNKNIIFYNLPILIVTVHNQEDKQSTQKS